jgi:hypothetical protein
VRPRIACNIKHRNVAKTLRGHAWEDAEGPFLSAAIVVGQC